MFKNVRPDSEERLELWKDTKDVIKSLLEELNHDAFENKGKIEEDVANFSNDRGFSIPNMVLTVKGIPEIRLGICTSSLSSLRICFIFSVPGYSPYYCDPDVSTTNIPNSIKLLLHKELG